MADEIKRTDSELLRLMVQVFNNSIITNQTAAMLSNKLDKEDMAKLKEWFRYAQRDIDFKTSQNKNRRF